MSSVKIPASKSYQDSLLRSLQDPAEAAAYLLAALGDAGAEPELLQAVLQDVNLALGGSPGNIAAVASQPLNEAMPRLVAWLETVGLELTIVPKK